MFTWKHLGKLYSAYANHETLATYLHDQASWGRCTRSAANHRAVAKEVGPQQPVLYIKARAKEFGATAAMAPIAAFKIVDGVFGTGLNTAGRVRLNSMDDVTAHLGQVLCSPTDTGLAGLAAGAPIALFGSLGSLIGAVIGVGVIALGATYNALGGRGFKVSSPQTIASHCAATGALVATVAGTALFMGVGAMATVLATNGLVRCLTGAAKAALAGAFYGGGYALGAAVAGVQLSFSPSLQPPRFLGAALP